MSCHYSSTKQGIALSNTLGKIWPPPGGWTTDDLDALPEDGIRRELIDGVLFVSPSPTNIHQTVAARLVVALEEGRPPEFDVTQGVEVQISRRRSLIPDVLVALDAAAARGPAKFAPDEVVLAIEIVSPSSRSLDRILKPALYAQAGIPFYWRVETKSGLVAHTHRLDPDHEVYIATGEFDTTIDTDEPWPVKIPIDRLTPRHLRAQ